MKNLYLILIAAMTAMMTGCVTTGSSGSAGQSEEPSLKEKLGVQTVGGFFSGKVVAVRVAPGKASTFMTADNKSLAEMFIVLPAGAGAQLGSTQHAATMALMKKTGEILKANADLDALVYTAPSFMSDPVMNGFVTAANRSAGAQRVNIKSDMRMVTNGVMPILWIYSRNAAKQDGLLSMQARGLIDIK